jgi:hypothetical protein
MRRCSSDDCNSDGSYSEGVESDRGVVQRANDIDSEDVDEGVGDEEGSEDPNGVVGRRDESVVGCEGSNESCTTKGLKYVEGANCQSDRRGRRKGCDAHDTGSNSNLAEEVEPSCHPGGEARSNRISRDPIERDVGYVRRVLRP